MTVTAAPAPAAAPAKPEASVSAIGDSGSIRVSVEKIDELMNTVGELVITQAMLGQLGSHFDGPDAEKLRGGLAQLERNMRELQESVMRVRMLPISFVFSRFPRMVRDLAQRLGKQIELKLTGEQTELDKTVLEKIGDPLVHLVRNSIDHGIESPEARVAAGKPAEGTVHLDACHRGGNIAVEVSDDGGGLDKDRILAKARARGLVGPNDTLTDTEIHELIFVPGFSTAEKTTDLSGRGVGMDVVRRNVKELGGKIEVRSEPGRGSRFTITLPLTLAIVDGQSVAVGTETYIVPLISIVESMQLKASARQPALGPQRGALLPRRLPADHPPARAVRGRAALARAARGPGGRRRRRRTAGRSVRRRSARTAAGGHQVSGSQLRAHRGRLRRDHPRRRLGGAHSRCAGADSRGVQCGRRRETHGDEDEAAQSCPLTRSSGNRAPATAPTRS